MKEKQEFNIEELITQLPEPKITKWGHTTIEEHVGVILYCQVSGNEGYRRHNKSGSKYKAGMIYERYAIKLKNGDIIEIEGFTQGNINSHVTMRKIEDVIEKNKELNYRRGEKIRITKEIKHNPGKYTHPKITYLQSKIM